MADAAINQVYMASYRWSVFAQQLINTFYFRLDTIDDPVTVSQAYTDLHLRLQEPGEFSEVLRRCVPNNVMLDGIDYQVISPVRLRKQRVVLNVPGLGVDPTTTSNLSQAVGRFPEDSGPGSKGGVRLIVSPLAVTSGVLTAAQQVLLDDFADELRSQPVATANLVFSQGYMRGTGTPPIPTFAKTFATTPFNVVRSMARRVVGRGI